MHRCVASVFADIFRDLERCGMLDPLNETDLYCQHYVFLPRINKCLKEFKESWNHHPLSSEGSRSPYQLFLEGLICSGRDSHSRESPANIDVGLSGTSEQISVPRITFFPCSSLIQHIHAIDPLQLCSDNGVSLFFRVIRTVAQHLNTQCHQCVLH